jgi:hypothetical protein
MRKDSIECQAEQPWSAPVQFALPQVGPDYFNLRNEDAITHRLVKKLTGLGYHVTLEPVRAEAGSETA